MRKIWIIVVAAFIMGGCAKGKIVDILPLEGNYEGTFRRTAPNATYTTSAVTLRLSGHDFSGSSSVLYYPVIGPGIWKAGNGYISFHALGPWTANFDWTLILDRDFQYERSNGQLILRRSGNNGVIDTYTLHRVP